MPKKPSRCRRCKKIISKNGDCTFCLKRQATINEPTQSESEISESSQSSISAPSTSTGRRAKQRCRKCGDLGHNAATCRRKKRQKVVTESVPPESVEIVEPADIVPADIVQVPREIDNVTTVNVDNVPSYNTENLQVASEIDNVTVNVDNVPSYNPENLQVSSEIENVAAVDTDNQINMEIVDDEIIEHRNQDISIEAEVEECHHCHRRSSHLYSVIFTLVNYEISRRQYGDRELQQGQTVCIECSYYTDKYITHHKWCNAWPSFFYSMLTKDEYNIPELSSHIVGVLPASIRSTYDAIVLREGTGNVIHSWTREAIFSDMTQTIEKFESEVSTSFGKLKQWMNATAFPCIRCPVGCYQYVSEKSKYDLIPLNHFIVTKYNRNLFDSSKLHCRGFRPDFPCIITEFEEFVVQPALIIDRQKGPCILGCNSEVHSTPSKDFIHIPTNPVWSGLGQYLPVDVLAPVTLNPNFIQAGNDGTYNTSFPVIRLKGTASGVSSFTLNPMRSEFHSRNKQENSAAGLSLSNRPDIYEACRDTQLLIDGFAQSTKEIFANEYKDQVAIEKAKKTGTYVTVHDCLHLIKLAKDEAQKAPEGEKVKVKTVAVGVHPMNNHGRAPVMAPYFTDRSVADQKCLLFVNSLLNIIGNCLPIYSALIKSSHQSAVVAIKELNDLIVRIHSKTRKEKLIQKTSYIGISKKLLLMTYDRITDALDNYPTEQLVFNMLKHFLRDSDTTFLQYDGTFTIVEQLQCIGEVVVIQLLNDVEELPQSSGDKHLIFSLECTEERNVITFRWLTTNGFYTFATNASPKKLDEFPAEVSAKLVIYATTKSLLCLSEDEFLQMGGIQTKVKCAHHNVNLVRRSRGTDDECSLCKRKRAYICSSIMTDVLRPLCNTGVCMKHEKDIRAGLLPTHVFPKILPPRRPEENSTDEDQENIAREEFTTFEFPEITHGDGPAQLLPDIVTSKTKNRPLYRVDVSRETSGHFLTNHYLGCMSRPFINRKCPIVFQQSLSAIHAVSGQNTYPLLQPEGYLFPTIFWESAQDGSTVGALPSAMFNDHVGSFTPKSLANLEDHMQVRIRDFSLLTSKSPQYLSFAFDVLLNRTLQSNPVALCFNRGLEHLNRGSSSFTDKSSRLQFDQIDSNHNARKLAGMLRKDNWTYFVTLTSCDSKTMGLAPIRAAIDRVYGHDESMHSAVLQNCAILFVRSWNRTLEYLFKTIEKDDSVFGRVKRYFARVEFQSAGAKGNRSHIHAGITVEPNTMTKAEIQNKIENMMSNAFSYCHETDLESTLQKGIVSSEEHYKECVQFYEKCQIHTCSVRCCKRMPDFTMKCRYRRHPPSFKHSYQEFGDTYFPVIDIMDDIGLAEFNENTGELDVVKELRPGVYHPATEIQSRAVPTIPILTFITESQTNVQVCDARSGAAYTAKYATKPEERRQVIVTKNHGQTVNVEALPLYNSGIPSAKTAEEILRRKQHKDNPLMREISFAETTHFVTGDPFVFHNMEFVEINTNHLEHRCSLKTYAHAGPSQKLVNDRNELKLEIPRRNFPRERQFTNDQLILVRDLSSSPYALDNTSAFSLRPPELLHIKQLELYSTWFTRKTADEYSASLDIQECPLIDGGCYTVMIRDYHLNDVCNFFRRIAEADGTDATALQMLQLLQDLVNEREQRIMVHNNVDASDKMKRFVDLNKTKETIPVFSSITPAKMDKFIHHLILSMGEFTTELDFLGLSSKQALEKAGLIAGDATEPMESVRALCKKYIWDQLRFLGIGSREFCRLVKLCYDGLKAIICNDSIEFGSVPLLTQRAIEETALEKLQQFEDAIRKNLLKALEFENAEDVQRIELMDSGEGGDDIEIAIVAAPGQSNASFHEQTAALNFSRCSIDNFINPATKFQKSIFLSGPPGAGKTFIFQKAIMICLIKKLRVVVTALTSERARKLGGEHIHYLFCIPVQLSNNESCSGLASKTISELIRNPIKMAFLKRIDVLAVEELGLVSSHILAVIDTVLRSIRETDQPYGGVLLITTGDNEQLAPVNGTSVFRTTSFSLFFDVLQLTEMVRARADDDLQNVINLIRKHKLTRNEKKQVVDIIKTRCSSNFVSDVTEVPRGVLSIVGLRKAEEETNRKVIEKMLSEGQSAVYISDAEDTVSSGLGSWSTADKSSSFKIDRQSLEPKKLHIFHNSIYKLTFNNNKISRNLPRFSQGQQCIVTELPSELNEYNVTVRVMPPGCRVLPSQNIPDDWPEAKLKRRHNASSIVSASMAKGRRLQFPLRHNICSTVHKAIGETCPAICTMISKTNSIYRLWDKQQLLVIISRVPTLSNIFFVGQVRDTIDAIKDLLNQTDPMLKLQSDVINSLDVLKHTQRIIRAVRPLQWDFIDCSIPSVNMGFVYTLANSQNINNIITGQCINIKRELELINAPSFKPNYGPFILIAFFYNFIGDPGEDSNKDIRKQLHLMITEGSDTRNIQQQLQKNRDIHLECSLSDNEFFNKLILQECYRI